NERLHLRYRRHIRIAPLQSYLRSALEHDQRYWFGRSVCGRRARSASHSTNPRPLRGAGLLSRAAPDQRGDRVCVHTHAVLGARLVLRRASLCAASFLGLNRIYLAQDGGKLLRPLRGGMAARTSVCAWTRPRSGHGRLGKLRLQCGLQRNVLANGEVVVAPSTIRGTQPVPAVHNGSHCWVLGLAARGLSRVEKSYLSPTDEAATGCAVILTLSARDFSSPAASGAGRWVARALGRRVHSHGSHALRASCRANGARFHGTFSGRAEASALSWRDHRPARGRRISWLPRVCGRFRLWDNYVQSLDSGHPYCQ